MTQPHLFAELDFNAKNVRQWAKEQVAKEPKVLEVRYTKRGRTERMVKNTVRRVLIDVVSNIYAMSLVQYDKQELVEECMAYITGGVHNPITQMSVHELLTEIVGETTENFEIASMDDFVSSAIVTGDF